MPKYVLKPNYFLIALLLGFVLIGCDDNIVGTEEEKPLPIEYESAFPPSVTDSLVAFIIVYGDYELPDSSALALAPFSRPGDYVIVDIGDNFGAPRFNPSKSFIAYSYHSLLGQKGYDVISDSARFVTHGKIGGSTHALTWINDHEYIQNTFLSPGWQSMRRNVTMDTVTEQSQSILLAGAPLLPGGLFALYDDDLSNVDGRFRGLYDSATDTATPVSWFDNIDTSFMYSRSTADYDPATNALVIMVRGPSTNRGKWRMMLRWLNGPSYNVFQDLSGREALHPRWVVDSNVIYTAVIDDNFDVGKHIKILDARSGRTSIWISSDNIPGATGVAFPDY